MTASPYRDHRFWLFDLDNTLYPPEVALFDQISAKMGEYIAAHLGLPAPEAARLRDAYWHRYGATLTGLRIHHGLDEEDFLSCTHDITFSAIPPDPALAAAIAALPGQKWVFTNSTAPYARSVLQMRGMEGIFEGIFGLSELLYHSKPAPEAYEIVLKATAIDPKLCVMFEDDPRNLIVPKALGMGTVLIAKSAERFDHVDYVTSDLTAFLTSLQETRHGAL